MKKAIIIIGLLVLGGMQVFAQDYFTDRKGNGTPIIFSSNGSDQLLFNAGIDVSDKSNLKANIFKQYWLNQKGYNADASPRNKNLLGWGLSIKAGTTNGTGSLFGSGDLSPSFTGGAYVAYTNLGWNKNKDGQTVFSNWALILSTNLSYAHEQFFDPAQVFAKQLSSSTFHGSATSFSGVRKFHGVDTKTNWFVGGSVTVSYTNNYDDLTQVQIKNDSLITGTGTTRTVTQTNKNGDIYAQGKYIEYVNTQLRANFTIVPGQLDDKIGFTCYPSVDLSSVYSAKYNVGLAVSLLKDKSPSTTTAAIFFELDDINNAAASTKPFLKRSFKVGVSTTLNVLTGGR